MKASSKKCSSLFLIYLHILSDLLLSVYPQSETKKECVSDDCLCVCTQFSDAKIQLKCERLKSVVQFVEAMNSCIDKHSFISDIEILNSSIMFTPELKSLPIAPNFYLKRFVVVNSGLLHFPLQTLSDFKNIEEIDISGNSLTSVSVPKSESLKFLNHSGNQVSALNLTYVSSSFPNLQSLDISKNRISMLYNDSLDVHLHNYTVNLSENGPWNCEQRLIYLINAIKEKEQPFIFKCSSPWNLEGMNWSQANSVFTTDTCKKCDCFLANEQKAMAINCTATDLKSLPQNLPVDTKIVNLTNNRIEFLTLPVTATDWLQVRFLYLSNNSIASFQGFEGTKLLKNLALLEIQDNKLEQIPKHVLEQLSVIYEIYLGKNPYVCNCNTITFQEWLHKHSKQVHDINSIKCHKSPPISGIPKSELCPQATSPIEYLDILSGTLAFLTIAILMKLVYDWFWQRRTGKLPQFFKINR